MDDKTLLGLLESVDDPVYAEAPPGFDRYRAEERFADLVGALLLKLGRLGECETGPYIQDASFHGDVLLPRELLSENYVAGLRVSNFGDLATIYDSDEVVRPARLVEIVATLESLGYRYVPGRILSLPYTGKNPGVSGFSNWGDRYFDYI